MSRFILIREVDSDFITVVDKQNGTAEQVEAASFDFDAEDNTEDKDKFTGIAAAFIVADGFDPSARYHYRA